MRAFDLDSVAEPDALLQQAMAEPGPCLINVPIGIEEDVTPMVPPGAANTTMIGDGHDHN
jgi:acetolactate synthase-1/2/3 large subunit